jgi:2-polyprenyl-6-methoxyphenol hydroxylase-like FAD-dependent oxidoreductase
MILNNAVDTDVLIVGAGPVGLFLANECARRGLRFRIIETHHSQSEHSKALAIFPRTLEIFDMAGVVAPFLEAANRVRRLAIRYLKQRKLHPPRRAGILDLVLACSKSVRVGMKARSTS